MLTMRAESVGGDLIFPKVLVTAESEVEQRQEGDHGTGDSSNHLHCARSFTNAMGVSAEQTSPNRAPGRSLQPAAPPAVSLPVSFQGDCALGRAGRTLWVHPAGSPYSFLTHRQPNGQRKQERSGLFRSSEAPSFHSVAGPCLVAGCGTPRGDSSSLGSSFSIPHRGFLEISSLGLDVPLAVVLTQVIVRII